MHQLNRQQLDRLRALLGDKHRALTQLIVERQSLASRLDGSDEMAEITADEREGARSDEVDVLLSRREGIELAEVGQALQRMDDGDYGTCVACGKPIAYARLEVQPAAAKCTACQEASER